QLAPLSSSPEMAALEIPALYPNPAADELTLTCEKSMEGTCFVLYEISGREVERIKTEGYSMQISLAHLQKGFYQYQFLKGKNILRSGKLIITNN
ncbi:MAG: T9SS type A sorting domain-containing protein, partial [Bacteroidota bacterium]